MDYFGEFRRIVQNITKINMTVAEALDHLFSLVWNSSLKTNVSGQTRRYLRPTNSTLEDVTVNILNPTDFDQLQSGVFNVNVFVPNPEYDAVVDGKSVHLRDIPDQQRIKVLAALCNVALKFNYDKPTHVLVELQTQNILPEKEQTIINNRVKLIIKNL